MIKMKDSRVLIRVPVQYIGELFKNPVRVSSWIPVRYNLVLYFSFFYSIVSLIEFSHAVGIFERVLNPNLQIYTSLLLHYVIFSSRFFFSPWTSLPSLSFLPLSSSVLFLELLIVFFLLLSGGLSLKFSISFLSAEKKIESV